MQERERTAQTESESPERGASDARVAPGGTGEVSAEQHRAAAFHHEAAAHHYREAARHSMLGDPEEAARHAQAGREHERSAADYAARANQGARSMAGTPAATEADRLHQLARAAGADAEGAAGRPSNGSRGVS